MRSTGFVAPLCVEGAVNGQLFEAWVEQQLVAALRVSDVVVLDNLSSHKTRGVLAAIEAVGAEVRFLPPYSPNFNPIELAFSKKQLCQESPRRLASGPGSFSSAPLEKIGQLRLRITTSQSKPAAVRSRQPAHALHPSVHCRRAG